MDFCDQTKENGILDQGIIEFLDQWIFVFRVEEISFWINGFFLDQWIFFLDQWIFVIRLKEMDFWINGFIWINLENIGFKLIFF